MLYTIYNLLVVYCQVDEVVSACTIQRNALCNGFGTCECNSCSCVSEWGGEFCEIPVGGQLSYVCMALLKPDCASSYMYMCVHVHASCYI